MKLLKIPRRTLVVPHVDLRQFYRQVRRVSKTARRRLGGEEWTSVRVRFLWVLFFIFLFFLTFFVGKYILSTKNAGYLFLIIGLFHFINNFLKNILLFCRKFRKNTFYKDKNFPVIYHQGPQYYHATAALSILANGKIEGPRMLAFNRELFTQRKVEKSVTKDRLEIKGRRI